MWQLPPRSVREEQCSVAVKNTALKSDRLRFKVWLYYFLKLHRLSEPHFAFLSHKVMYQDNNLPRVVVRIK